MIVITHFCDGTDDVAQRAQTALAALAARPGYLRGTLGRSTDDPAAWLLLTEWDNVGSYRRALGNYEVKLHATLLLAYRARSAQRFRTAARRGARRRGDHEQPSDREPHP